MAGLAEVDEDGDDREAVALRHGLPRRVVADAAVNQVKLAGMSSKDRANRRLQNAISSHQILILSQAVTLALHMGS